jgi:hypothetical protein
MRQCLKCVLTSMKPNKLDVTESFYKFMSTYIET